MIFQEMNTKESFGFCPTNIQGQLSQNFKAWKNIIILNYYPKLNLARI